MIRKLLNSVSRELYYSEQKTNNLFKYSQLREHHGWKVHQMLMISIANKMSEYMLSEQFTRLSIEEKDANQRAMHMTKEIIDFLFDPMKGAKNVLKAEAHNRREATKRKRPKGGTA